MHTQFLGMQNMQFFQSSHSLALLQKIFSKKTQVISNLKFTTEFVYQIKLNVKAKRIPLENQQIIPYIYSHLKYPLTQSVHLQQAHTKEWKHQTLLNHIVGPNKI